MVQPIFKDMEERQVEVDLGEIEKKDPEKINVYLISNRKAVPERKRDRMIDLIMEISIKYDDMVLVTLIDDEAVSLGPVNAEIGPVPFKLYFQKSNQVEATATKDEKVDLFLKDLFVSLQSFTNDLFSIFPYNDHASYLKKGICALNSENDDIDDSQKEFLSIEEYMKDRDKLSELVDKMNKITQEK